MSLTILTWIFSLITVCFISCLAGIHSFVIWVLQLYKLWDLVGWWISKEQHKIFVFFFSSSESHGQTKLHQMIEITLPFWKNIGCVSLFSRVCENRKGNIMSLASKMHLDIHLFAVCFCSSSHYFKMFSWSHNLLYIINPVHALLIKNICYLIWFVLIRRGYIIGHKAQMENSISQINCCEYLDSTENTC